MDSKVLINTGNIDNKVLITDNRMNKITSTTATKRKKR